MSSATQGQGPSPLVIFDALNAYQRTAALRTGIDLNLFTAIGEGNHDVPAIARRVGASEKGTRVLCDYLVVIGLLKKDGAAYSLTPDSAVFLDRRSPACIADAAQFLGSIRPMFDTLTEAVRKGGTTLEGQGSVEDNNPLWIEFAHSMAPLMALPAEMIAQQLGASQAGAWKVLDIAAGHGLFGIALARHNSQANIVAVDWAAVLDVARENARNAGVDARYSTKPGSAFDVDFGPGYDLALLTNFLHHFDQPTCEGLLRKIHASLADGGRVVTLEFIPNDDRISPPSDAMFSLMMLGTTPSGDAYTFAEYDRMFRNAGFSRSELRELKPLPQRIVVSYK
jgi:ubiquinone/menaquinone biosynthesis C-methylase UbiE